jgi:uncharacterized protein YggU (UPF0235/DUF167 family)
MTRKFDITDARGGAALPVRVVTQAERTELMGVQDDGVLRIRLMASPASAPAANAELLGFIAGLLDVPERSLDIVAGASGREKIVSVVGLTVEEVEERLHVT